MGDHADHGDLDVLQIMEHKNKRLQNSRAVQFQIIHFGYMMFVLVVCPFLFNYS